MLAVLFFICSSAAADGDFSITDFETKAELTVRYDKAFQYTYGADALLFIELNNAISIYNGLSYNLNNTYTEYTASLEIGINLGIIAPRIELLNYFSFNILYLFDSIPEYNVDIHSVIPYFSLNLSRFGVSFGPQMRWNNYFKEFTRYETIYNYMIRINLIKHNKINVDFAWGNFDYFYAGSYGEDYIRFVGTYIFNDKLRLSCTIDLYQAGRQGGTASLFGFSFKSGVIIKW